MLEYLIRHQLNIILVLCGMCLNMAILLLFTKALTTKRRRILILMELTPLFLLGFDRLAYIYAGDTSDMGYIMVRVSNFVVFFLTSEIVFAFNLYLKDLLTDEGGMEEIPRLLRVVQVLSVIGMVMAVLAAFTGLYYTFDENNIYHRSPTFLLCYILPIVGPVMQFVEIRRYRDKINRYIYISLNLFLIVPICASIAQIFIYGLSLTNMAMVLMSIGLYIFAYLDINDRVRLAHKREMEHLEENRIHMERLFDQTVTAFVSAIDERDAYTKDHSKRVADYARRLAEYDGMNEEECNTVYYAALLHDVGKIDIPESIINKEKDLTDEEREILKQKPLIGNKILSEIHEYPGLNIGARYVKERYDGKGYPDGLMGESIPRIARLIAVADAYDAMTSKNSFREALPQPFVREEFVREAGSQFDPGFANAMVRLIDMDTNYGMREKGRTSETELETELSVKEYRSRVTSGIVIDTEETLISFTAVSEKEEETDFSMPSIIIFDSYDAHVHNRVNTIGAYKYTEYAEVWFDGHYVSTMARNIRVTIDDNDGDEGNNYAIRTLRYNDHLRLKLICDAKEIDVIIALPSGSMWAYVGLTGENCRISDIKVEKTGVIASEKDIPRISDEINYIDRIESDLPNMQIEGTRSVTTPGVPVKDMLRFNFHTMSLPTASLVWHCPYIVLYASDDGTLNGRGYREYAFIKLNGEDDGNKEYAHNSFSMKKNTDFVSWDDWKLKNRKGYECEVRFTRRGKKISIATENIGIEIHNVTTILDDPGTVYAAITGDECAITDIRVD